MGEWKRVNVWANEINRDVRVTDWVKDGWSEGWMEMSEWKNNWMREGWSKLNSEGGKDGCERKKRVNGKK